MRKLIYKSGFSGDVNWPVKLNEVISWRVFDVVVEKLYDLVPHLRSSRDYTVRPESERMIDISRERYHCVEVRINSSTHQGTAHIFDLVRRHSRIAVAVDKIQWHKALLGLRFYLCHR